MDSRAARSRAGDWLSHLHQVPRLDQRDRFLSGTHTQRDSHLLRRPVQLGQVAADGGFACIQGITQLQHGGRALLCQQI